MASSPPDPGEPRPRPGLAGTLAAAAPERRPPPAHRGRGPAGLRIAAVLVAVAFAAPFAYLVYRNLGAGTAFLDAVLDVRTAGPLARSMLLATSVSVATAAIGTATAWLVTRTDLPGVRLWRILLPLPLVIPSFIGAFALIAAFAPGGLVERLLGVGGLPEVRGFVGAFVVLTLLTYPYVHLPVAARLNQLSPSLEEAARLLRRSPGASFRTVVLPQLRGAILAGTLLVFLYVISDFGAVELLRYDTLTRAIYATRIFDAATSLALSFELGALAILVAVLERITTHGPLQERGTRAVRGLSVRLGRWRVAALAGLSSLLGLALVAPLAVLTYWSVRGLVRGSTRASALVTDLGSLVEPALNTARVSVAAALVAIVVVVPVAFLAVRYRSRVADVANALVLGGFALPGLAIALAFVFWLRATPAYQTEAVLIAAYVVHFGAQSLRAADVAVASVPARLDEAAQVLGASRWRRLRQVELPLMAPGLLAGGGLVLLSTMKELPATLLLAPNGFQTLATRIWLATQDAFLADASIASLLLVALSGVLTWLLVIRRADAF